MENSIKEDIILLKDFTEGNFKSDKLENYKGSYKMGYFYYKDIQQAIEHLLSDYKRLLKENEELNVKILSNAGIYQLGFRDGEKTYIQKVKDKIEELKKDKDSKYYYMFLEKRDIENTIKVLKEILKEVKKDGNGYNV